MDVLTPSDDPNRWAKDIKTDWLVTDKLQLGSYDSANVKWKSSVALHFHSGDFVDVGLSFEIVQRAERDAAGRNRYDVHLALRHVAQIYKGTEIPYVRSLIWVC